MTSAPISRETYTLMALSPLDGRYDPKLGALRPLLSEFGYMKCRVQVELAWLQALSEAGLPELAPLSEDALTQLKAMEEGFSIDDAAAIKAIEKVTNHDVKAVEYWIKGQFKSQPELEAAQEFVHFACTSEDINNTSHALQLKATRQEVLLPMLETVIARLREMAHQHAATPMLSRTHGQTASPTTVGKELANFVVRLQSALDVLARIPIKAKMNGAVGNYNAHLAAYPDVDWERLSAQVVEKRLGLTFQPYSTQIEQHDAMAALFDTTARINTILIDLCRDVWGYVSLGYFKQKAKASETGSSTMPHKVNPIDFENAEGNLGLANAMLRHLSEKLPISRWQRDLTDSTVLRNMGVGLGYALLAYQSLLTGLSKLEVNPAALAQDLERAWEVLAEPIQTVMRRYGLPEPYEALKAYTRDKTMNRELMHSFIAKLDIPEAEKARLLALTPADYVGKAAELALRA